MEERTSQSHPRSFLEAGSEEDSEAVSPPEEKKKKPKALVRWDLPEAE